jgi:3-isopropylmalate dehydrogenase
MHEGTDENYHDRARPAAVLSSTSLLAQARRYCDSVLAMPVWEWMPECCRPIHMGDPYRLFAMMGEGIGPEVMGAALDVLDAIASRFGHEIDIVRTDHVGSIGPWGLTVDDATRSFFDRAFAADAPVLTGPAGGRFVYDLRAQFDLWCKLIPVRPMPELADASIVRPERVASTDVLIVRDNSGGIYQGRFGRDADTAYQEASYSAHQVDRIVQVAARAATARRGRLAVVTKPGGIPAISALWAERATAVIESDLEMEVIEVDNACFQLVADPHRFDVVVTPNLIGDVVADTAALVLGSRGLAVSANYGKDGRTVYQTGHGAAHDLAGRDVANPIAQIQSLQMLMAQVWGMHQEAAAVGGAITQVLGAGLRTPDIAGPTSTVVGTRELGQRIAAAVSESESAVSESADLPR